jgi:GntR family transcriptional regulator / MocR family aminotransferase
MTGALRLQTELHEGLRSLGPIAIPGVGSPRIRPQSSPRELKAVRSSPQQLLSMPARSGPLYLQIYHRIRSLIITGAWGPGTRLPSSRSLARDLGISRNTAILALDKLMSDGWIQARPGSGIYVSCDAPPARSGPATSVSAESPTSPAPALFELVHGAIDLFPVAEWGKIQGRVWTRSSDQALLEGSGAGWQPLRQAIAGYLHAVRGLACSPEQILIMSSSRAAVDLTLRVLGDAGDRIWTEDPGHRCPRDSFKTDDLHRTWIPVDGQGMNISLGKNIAPDARFAYVSPACQFPTCAILGGDRRAELLEWAKRNDSFIIENDRDFNAVFDRQHPPEPLAASSPENTVFIHSFNRLLFPALRVAALVVPPGLVSRFVEARLRIDGFPNTANQIALTEFIERGLLSSFLRKSKLAYEQRRAAMHTGIRERLSDLLWVDESQAGLAAVAFTHGAKASELAAVANRAGIACKCLSDFSGQNVCSEALVLGFGPFRTEVIDDGIARLAEAFSNSR